MGILAKQHCPSPFLCLSFGDELEAKPPLRETDSGPGRCGTGMGNTHLDLLQTPLLYPMEPGAQGSPEPSPAPVAKDSFMSGLPRVVTSRMTLGSY